MRIDCPAISRAQSDDRGLAERLGRDRHPRARARDRRRHAARDRIDLDQRGELAPARDDDDLGAGHAATRWRSAGWNASAMRCASCPGDQRHHRRHGGVRRRHPAAVRGIGALETATTIDGHPVAYGFPGGYNFQLSPLAPFRDLSVTYGSGSNVLGTSAIGGVIGLRTLAADGGAAPVIDQGWGSYGHSATTWPRTGTPGGSATRSPTERRGLGRPVRHQTASISRRRPTTSPQPSPAVRSIGTYDADGGAVAQHSTLAKLQLRSRRRATVVATGLFGAYFENKTGNGDADYLGPAPALALAQQKAGTGAAPPGSFP